MMEKPYKAPLRNSPKSPHGRYHNHAILLALPALWHSCQISAAIAPAPDWTQPIKPPSGQPESHLCCHGLDAIHQDETNRHLIEQSRPMGVIGIFAGAI